MNAPTFYIEPKSSDGPSERPDEFLLTTTQVLADASQKQWLWKSPEMLAIAVTVIKYFVEHDGPAYVDDLDLSFVTEDSTNCIGNVFLTLRRRGLLEMTRNWRRSKKKSSRKRLIWEYRIGSYALCKAFLARNKMPIAEKQEQLL